MIVIYDSKLRSKLKHNLQSYNFHNTGYRVVAQGFPDNFCPYPSLPILAVATGLEPLTWRCRAECFATVPSPLAED
jgi:hypothetical protein